MRDSPALRWALAAVAAAAAVAIAVATGLHTRTARKPSPPAPAPAAVPATDPQRQWCAERLKKLGQALRLYAADYHDAFPVADTPAGSGVFLGPRLKSRGIAAGDLRCPTAEGLGGQPYVYYCYRELGAGTWPNWMPDKHLVTRKSPPDTWLLSDVISRDAPGPHSATEKAFNYLRADGSVQFHVGRPREVYR